LLIRCVLENGRQGFGEGVPRDYVTGETIDSAFELLKRSEIGSQLEPCRDFGEAVALAERLRVPSVPGDSRGCQGNSTRCAIELAMLDAYGQHFSQPLSAVTQRIAPELHEPRRRVRYSGAIAATQGLKLRLAARRLWVYGFKHIKVKVGIEGQDDVRRLRLIRAVLGSKKDLRVDANEAWEKATVVQRIRDLAPFGISAVEQPLPHDEADFLAEVRRQTHIPIMLDESLCSHQDAEDAISRRRCDLFNLRLSKCGGFIPTLRLAQFAWRHGLGYQLGCQVGETALLSAAGRHFACSVTGLRYVEGSYDRHLVRVALGTRDITFGWRGWGPALEGAGLGISVDNAALEKVTLRKEPLLG
jgi:muconate cycloisomerase